jgi:hypothetical protein
MSTTDRSTFESQVRSIAALRTLAVLDVRHAANDALAALNAIETSHNSEVA